MSRKYYVGHSYMGTNFTYDSPCWRLFAFTSQTERKAYLDKYEYNQDTGNRVAEAITRKQAEKILGCSVDSERVRVQQFEPTMWEISQN